jgi:hypothetical protein
VAIEHEFENVTERGYFIAKCGVTARSVGDARQRLDGDILRGPH